MHQRLVESSGGGELKAHPYQNYLPTFGSWGYVLATRQPFDPSTLKIVTDNRYLTQAVLPSLFVFPPDIDRRGDAVPRFPAPRGSTRRRGPALPVPRRNDRLIRNRGCAPAPALEAPTTGAHRSTPLLS